MPLERYNSNIIDQFPERGLVGRRKIKTSVNRVTVGNVADVLGKALTAHYMNAAEISYLYDYYRGKQDIRFKTKHVRENINEKVMVNRASEIVAFKSAFLLEEPIQYVSRGGDDETSALVNALNDYMVAANKEASDKELIDWMHICGVGVRIALRPDGPEEDEAQTDAPFVVYTLDPRDAFVIYHDGIGEKPLAGVVLGVDEDGTIKADVYTKTTHFVVRDSGVTTASSPQYGGIPLVEYENNKARMGAFEGVIPILNSINLLESNALDSVEDFVNGFDVFQNCDIEDGSYSQLSIGGKAVKIKTVTPGMEAKVYRVSSEISQSGVQTRIDDLTDAYLEICGMPNRNGGTSTSDTGTAVLFRDGWSTAASRAKDTETLYRKSEREFCKIVLGICRNRGVEVPEIFSFEPEFLAHKLSNLQSKVQALCEMLNNPYIHPKYAYSAAGVFDDNEAACRDGLAWHEAYVKAQAEALDKVTAR